MLLSKEEAISLVLFFSKGQTILSSTKLNKLVARLNLFFIPTEIDFSLNKWGSHDESLSNLQETEYYEVGTTPYKGNQVQKVILKDRGKEKAQEVIKKIYEVLTDEEVNELRSKIYELSGYSAAQISEDEHRELLVDADEKYKIKQTSSEIHIEMLDLYAEIDKVPANTIINIRFRALIEYCYYLTKYLKEKFERLNEGSIEYNFGAYMLDYYFIRNIKKNIIPFIKEQMSSEEKDTIKINKFYNFIVNSATDRYPFSLYNKNLKELIAR